MSETNFSKTVNQTLDKAVVFATERHAGQYRKGTTRPYIVHPLEAMQILNAMRADTELMVAGVLHDTVEDTNTTLEEIKEVFGESVAKLVAFNSEDKSKTWAERKAHTIEEVKIASKQEKMLVLADKLANLRDMAIDLRAVGNEFWKRFNATPTDIGWYYSSVRDAIADLGKCPECEEMLKEMNEKIKFVFGR